VEHRDGTWEMKDAPLKKSIYSLPLLRELMEAANRRYLEFVSAIEDPTVGIKNLEKLSYTKITTDAYEFLLNNICPIPSESEALNFGNEVHNGAELVCKGKARLDDFKGDVKRAVENCLKAQKELEKSIGKIVFLFFVVGVTLMAPLSIGIYASVQNLYATPNLSLGYMVGMYLLGLSGVVFGDILFVFYDRHYFSKNTKTNIIHSSILQ
jgi:hypothetical protein